MTKTKQYPSQEELQELFYYDGKDLRWKEDKKGHSCKDKIVGSIQKSNGYRVVVICGTLYLYHRVLWIYFNGNINNDYQIDHINHYKLDNRIENLRVVSHVENNKNNSMHFDNTSGINGVSWYGRDKKWKVQININKKIKCLGFFDNKADAYIRRKWADKKYGYHVNHGKNI